jgi:hypothetical protein
MSAKSQIAQATSAQSRTVLASSRRCANLDWQRGTEPSAHTEVNPEIYLVSRHTFPNILMCGLLCMLHSSTTLLATLRCGDYTTRELA